MTFFKELQRRNVFRASIAYVVIAWLIAQVLQLVFESFGTPEWVMKTVLVLLAAGFPLLLIFAWAFELTPEGLRRETSAGDDQARESGFRRKFNILIAVAIAAELAYFGLTRDWQVTPEGLAPGEIRSIVVLPLDNLMEDPSQGYFVEGMHEALITELSRIKALRVISRTSAMHYAESGKSVPQIAEELGVDAVIEGSVLKVGNTVRVTAQLIEGPTDRHIWAENFDRKLDNILALYADVTREIVGHIQVNVTQDEEANLAEARPVNPEVYALYLKGRHLCYTWGPQEMRQANDLLHQAARLDPEQAIYHALLAQCLVDSAFFEYTLPMKIESQARSAALSALQLDPDLAEAQVAMGAVAYYLDFDLPTADERYRRALELNPNSVDVLLRASWFYTASGRFDESTEITERAVALDPLSTVIVNAMGQIHYLSRDYTNAIEHFEAALELDRSDPSLTYYLASAHLQMGQVERAIELFTSSVELSDAAPLYLAALGHAYAVAGMEQEARQILKDLQQAAYPSPYNLAIVHIGLGEHELTIDWLEKAFEARSGHIVYVNRGPVFDPLRDNPRFQGLMDRMGW